MKRRHIWVYAAAALFLMFLTVGSYLVLSAWSFPKVRGSVTIEGLQAPVEILRDKYGVPHIYAGNAEDLFFAQGYVHAQDRFWQMDFSRRTAAGRLSEMFGKKLLETDIFLRTLGLTRLAQEEYQLLDGESRRLLDAYVAGVNAYIRGKKPGSLGLEYLLLKLTGTDFTVEEWKPEHSLTWTKMMSWTLSDNMDIERLMIDLVRTAGLKDLPGFFAPYREDMPTIMPGTGLVSKSGHADPIAALFQGGEEGLGTNSWVVAGGLTATGKPILANDTHLSVQMPSIWYEVGLHQGEGEPGAFQVRGFSFPGIPGVVIGHNSRIAWGIGDFTDDTQDLYIERINPANPNQYLVNGSWVDMERSYERIDIHGVREPYVHIARSTRHGPVISDRGGYKSLESFGFVAGGRFPEDLELSAISLRWSALEPGQLLRSVLDLDRAGDFEEFREALKFWDSPVQNITYADVDGNIGYQAAGKVPIRASGRGDVPAQGWTDKFEWTGYVPFEQLPSLFNPPERYIVAANNPAVGSSFPNFLGDRSVGVYGYRAQRIVEMITERGGGVSVDDMKVMQADTWDRAAVEITKYLEGIDLGEKDLSAWLKEKEPGKEKTRKKRAKLADEVEQSLEPARARLLAWDGRMERTSPEAALYSYFFLALMEETFRDQYPVNRWVEVSHERVQNALYYLLQDPQNTWWDDARTPDVRETRDVILVRALRRGLQNGIEELGRKPEKWQWGKVHTIEFRNATLGESGIKPIEKIFNRGPVKMGGGSATVNVARWKTDNPFKVYHIPAMRLVVDLNDIGNGFLMHAPGQSGHSGNRHYDDFIKPWRDVEYHPSLWHRADVEEHLQSRLVIKP